MTSISQNQASLDEIILDYDQVNRDPYQEPLATYDVANPLLFEAGKQYLWFKRLREEDPVHYCTEHQLGPYWSVTRYEDIMAVDTRPDLYSSEPAITIRNPDDDFTLPMFIAMDPPKHDEQRKVVNPAVGPASLKNFEPLIRERTADILDSLPLGQEFDWVDTVSIELTTRMLATLFDFPYEDRRKLTRWSDVSTAIPGMGIIDSEEQRRTELIECLQYFTTLWNQKIEAPPSTDFVSMLAHGSATQEMEPFEYLGNLILLIVGGNDTTRNTMSASVLALHQNPAEFAKLKAKPELIPSMVSETIRWQTPLAYMRRTAKVDTELRGKQIKAGDKVLMWYASGNRDDSVFERPDDYIIDRENVRRHLSFGFGIHRCMGNRLAELQLRVLWEEVLARFDRIEVIGEPQRAPSSFVNGYTRLPVIVHPKS